MSLSEAEELELLELENENAALAGGGDQPKPTSLIDEIGGFLKREGPPLGGAMAGAAALAPYGAPGGIPGVAFMGAAGAALGAAGGRGWQLAAQQMGGAKPPESGAIPGGGMSYGGAQNMGEVVKTGLSYGAGELVGQGAFGLGAKWLNAAKAPASKMTTALTGVPPRYSKAVYEDPGILSRAKPMEEAKDAYGQATGGMDGLRSPGAFQGATGKRYAQGGDLLKLASDTMDVHAAGTLTEQQALLGRQAIRQALYTQEGKVAQNQLLADLDALDAFLETARPGFKQASRDYFEANAANQFAQPVPLNKNQSPNALRGTGMAAAMWRGVTTADPSMMFAATLGSPWAHGLALRAAYASARAANATRPAIAAGTGTGIDRQRR